MVACNVMVVAALWVGSEELQGVLGIAWAVGEGALYGGGAV